MRATPAAIGRTLSTVIAAVRSIAGLGVLSVTVATSAADRGDLDTPLGYF
jgi:hypothetical protein